MSFIIKLFGVKVGATPPQTMILKRGEFVFFASWKWKKFGYVRKIAQINNDGKLIVKELD